ncbi:hypothetical protein LWI28_020998 [Acer negundo]|uniref:Uncharacterized protein n=1 Tax=Acer negundo TaxID=4023 RepID=A0AAD5ISF8_ACENE|nr:hypothetical protein LWI28_020998 [Acer negundo]
MAMVREELRGVARQKKGRLWDQRVMSNICGIQNLKIQVDSGLKDKNERLKKQNHGPQQKLAKTTIDIDKDVETVVSKKLSHKITEDVGRPYETLRRKPIKQSSKSRPLNIADLCLILNEMDVDPVPIPKDSCDFTVKEPVTMVMTEVLANNQLGPKSGKWKRWVCDGVKTENEIDSDGNLGKRSLASSEVSSKMLKIPKTNRGSLGSSKSISTNRLSLVCRKQ